MGITDYSKFTWNESTQKFEGPGDVKLSADAYGKAVNSKTGAGYDVTPNMLTNHTDMLNSWDMTDQQYSSLTPEYKADVDSAWATKDSWGDAAKPTAGLGTGFGMNTQTATAALGLGSLALGYLGYRDSHKMNKANLAASEQNLKFAKEDNAATNAYRASYGA